MVTPIPVKTRQRGKRVAAVVEPSPLFIEVVAMGAAEYQGAPWLEMTEAQRDKFRQAARKWAGIFTKVGVKMEWSKP